MSAGAPAPAPGRRLGLLRHAKAAPDPPAGGGDHERPLSPRGRRDASALGHLLAQGGAGFPPDALPSLALCSTAARTTETAERVLGATGALVDRRRRLYYGSPTDLLDEVRTVPASHRAVLVVGHNPAIAALAALLAADEDALARSALGAGSFPTCALAVYEVLAGPWERLAPGTATLVSVMTPPY